MTTDRSPDYLAGLVRELCRLPKETEWVEFEENKAEPGEIGEYLSALSNAAALAGKAFAYLLWGIADETHEVVGTSFAPSRAKVGNEELENWLLRLLSPRIPFRFFELEMDEYPLVILEIGRAFRHPVQFRNQEYIRVGSYKKKLKDHPEREAELWRIFDQTPFEDLVAAENVASEDVLRLLDYPAYFDLLDRPLPEGREGILQALEADELIRRSEAGQWDVTNLGAILLAKKLADFRSLRRKAVRVVVYKDNSRVVTVKEQAGGKGYANGFEGLIGFINGLLPSNEVIEQALRKSVPVYPELAVRELVANALIVPDRGVSASCARFRGFRRQHACDSILAQTSHQDGQGRPG
jgi:predicted HTH transcriptional regulator